MANKPRYKPVAVRFDDEDKSLLRAVSLHMKLPVSQVIRIAIRRMAQEEINGRKRA